jgi:hypothetical protein
MIGIFLSLFAIRNTLHQSDDILHIELVQSTVFNTNNQTHYKSGICEPNTINKDSYELRNKICESIQTKKILDLLESKHICVNEKIDIIKKYTVFLDEQLSTNILAGSLMDDWNFELSKE